MTIFAPSNRSLALPELLFSIFGYKGHSKGIDRRSGMDWIEAIGCQVMSYSEGLYQSTEKSTYENQLDHDRCSRLSEGHGANLYSVLCALSRF